MLNSMGKGFNKPPATAASGRLRACLYRAHLSVFQSWAIIEEQQENIYSPGFSSIPGAFGAEELSAWTVCH